ncbi:hypothetical protein AV530_003262 [Patagioenas fasciata monilis]|uniref:Uncharacterized protein n=1 Tax=Patagioenas fasciata monilis TaxID=372326 RepID=A0A1V4K1T5_PATFA|nr:hypothetical protein AV530_003262 [Patagioenas fasciata monilis]
MHKIYFSSGCLYQQVNRNPQVNSQDLEADFWQGRSRFTGRGVQHTVWHLRLFSAPGQNEAFVPVLVVLPAVWRVLVFRSSD